MEEIILSNSEDRIIIFGISEPERYKACEDKENDPWWDIHVLVKKPGIEINFTTEALTTSELIELSTAIKETKNRDKFANERIRFMEPDYSFDIAGWRGILHINLCYTDSLNIWLTRENLNDIASYIDAVIK